MQWVMEHNAILKYTKMLTTDNRRNVRPEINPIHNIKNTKILGSVLCLALYASKKCNSIK